MTTTEHGQAESISSPICIHASAPGKVIICGEYAVLQGQPALVLAADRRIQIQVISIDEPIFEVSAPGLQPEPETLQWQGSNLQLTKPASRLAMFTELFNQLAPHHLALRHFQQKGWRFIVDSNAFFDCGAKLGLGSSAALTVALDEALITLSQALPESYRAVPARAQALTPEARWAPLHHAHSLAQGKQGSGVDIAASLAGASVTFANHSHQYCEINKTTIPSGVHIAFLWTGESASTPAYLRSLSAWREHHQQAFDAHMHDLGLASYAVCQQSESLRFIAALSEFTERLKCFDDEAALGIFDAGHEDLFDLGKHYEHLVYKPCGAGGGDLGIAVSADISGLNTFVSQAEARGFRVVTLAVDPHGSIATQ